MTYATPSRFIQEYGLDDTVQLLSDEQRLLTGPLLLGAMAVAVGGEWTGSPTGDEQAAAVAGLARLQRKLDSAANFMDGYLRTVVALPLPADDANASTLEDCNCALTRCLLADDTDNATERMDKTCSDWRAWLKDVQAGRVTLVASGSGNGVSPGDALSSSGRVRHGQASSKFDWSRFGSGM